MIDLNPYPIRHLLHLHGRRTLKQFRHHALVRRVQVLNDDEGHAAGGRHVFKKLHQGLQTTGRGTDADNGKWALCSRLTYNRFRKNGGWSDKLPTHRGLRFWGWGRLFHSERAPAAWSRKRL